MEQLSHHVYITIVLLFVLNAMVIQHLKLCALLAHQDVQFVHQQQTAQIVHQVIP